MPGGNVLMSGSAENSEFLQEFYRRNRRALVIYAYSILGSYPDAEDAVHSAFIAIWALIDSDGFTLEKNRAYVYRAIHNTAINVIRKRNRDVGLIKQLSLMPDSTDPEILRIYNDLNVELKNLSPDEGSIIILKVIAGLKFREIAKVLDMPIRRVIHRYYVSMKELRRKLEAE